MSRIGRLASLAVLLGAAPAARAEGFADASYQSGRLIAVAWEGGRPLGNLRDFTGATTAWGTHFDLRLAVAHRLSLGLATSWSWYSRSLSAGTIELPAATLTGPVYRRAQFLTLRATAHWYLGGRAVQPFVGLGAGGTWGDTLQEAPGLAVRSRRYGVGVDPEAGLLVTFRPGVALFLQARYQLANNRFAPFQNPTWLALDAGLAVY